MLKFIERDCVFALYRETFVPRSRTFIIYVSIYTSRKSRTKNVAFVRDRISFENWPDILIRFPFLFYYILFYFIFSLILDTFIEIVKVRNEYAPPMFQSGRNNALERGLAEERV